MSENKQLSSYQDLKMNPLGNRFSMIGDLVQRGRLSLRLLLDKRVPIIQKLIPIAAIIYIISPVDIIPEFLLGLGVVDDLMIMMLALEGFLRTAPMELVEEHALELGFIDRMLSTDGDMTQIEEGEAADES